MSELLGSAFKNETVQPVSNFVRITEEIDQLLSEDTPDNQKALEAFVLKRTSELTATAPETEYITYKKEKPHNGFISPKTEVKGKIMYDGFHLDDPDLYPALLNGLKELKSTPGWKEMSIKALAVPAVNYAVSKYFGSYKISDEQEKQNAAHYMNLGAPCSIKEMKGKGIAVCAEKAAAAQNLLTFLGLDSELAMADCKLDPNQEEGPHAYNIVTGPNGHFIFDPTNPIVNDSAEGQPNYLPATYKISDEQYESLQNHQAVEVAHTNTKIVDGEQEAETNARVYNA
ncbi:MAG: hypothetical protein WCW17_00275 [Patescibacteria group bacterium]